MAYLEKPVNKQTGKLSFQLRVGVQTFYGVSTETLQGLYGDSTGTLRRLYGDSTETLRGLYGDSTMFSIFMSFLVLYVDSTKSLRRLKKLIFEFFQGPRRASVESP